MKIDVEVSSVHAKDTFVSQTGNVVYKFHFDFFCCVNLSPEMIMR